MDAKNILCMNNFRHVEEMLFMSPKKGGGRVAREYENILRVEHIADLFKVFY